MSAAYPPLPAANPAAGATQTWRTWLLYATLALMPLSFNVGYYLLASKKALYLSPLDPLLVPLLLLLVWDLFRGRVPHWMIPVPNAVWAAWALLSLAWVTGGSLEAWGKSALLQTTAIGLCAVWVFTHAATGAAAYRRLTLVLGASIGCCLLYALYQYSMPPGVPLPSGETGRFHGGGVTNVRLAGWYEYRGILAAQVAMFVPACVAFAALERDPALRVGAGALAALGLCVCMSGGGVIAACAGTLAVAGALLVSGKKGEAGASEASPASRGGIALDEVWKGWGAARLAGLIVASLLFFCLVVLPRLPRDHPTALRDSLSLYAQTQDGEGRTIDLPSARLRRYQAELNFLGHKEHWKKGAGAGQFQPALDPYFKPAYPKPGARTDDEAAFGLRANEPMTFGLYETTAVELGVVGLVALTWLFCTWIAAALSAFLRADPADAAARALALASLGACVGAAVFAVFGSPLVRGVGGTFAFFMGVALALQRQKTETRPY